MIKGLHHNAYRCRDSEETRRFYEDFLGLPLVDALRDRRDQDRAQDRRAAHVLRSWATARAWRSSRCPDMPFEFKEQHDFDLHIALEVERPRPRRHAGEGQGGAASRRAASPTTGSSTRSTSAIPTATSSS